MKRAERKLPTRSDSARKTHQRTVLVLQGGGALGAYQAGVYEGLAEAGLAPDWVAGVSIGAINAALIAGNSPHCRVQRLRAFWDRVSSTAVFAAAAPLKAMRPMLEPMSVASAATFGIPGFFRPRLPNPLFAPDSAGGPPASTTRLH
jgi:NTE family protein